MVSKGAYTSVLVLIIVLGLRSLRLSYSLPLYLPYLIARVMLCILSQSSCTTVSLVTDVCFRIERASFCWFSCSE